MEQTNTGTDVTVKETQNGNDETDNYVGESEGLKSEVMESKPKPDAPAITLKHSYNAGKLLCIYIRIKISVATIFKGYCYIDILRLVVVSLLC